MNSLLGGMLMPCVFQHVLPDERQSCFVWFLIGMLVFLALDVLSGK